MVVALLYPLAVAFLSAGVFIFLLISRQLNFYRMFMMLKRAARSISRLHAEFRVRLHTGFRDYNGDSLDEEERLHLRIYSYVKQI